MLKPAVHGISRRANVSARILPTILAVGCLLSFICAMACTREGAGETADADRPFRVGTTMHIKQPNPVTDYYYNLLAMLMTHESLVRFDSELQPVPCLASEFGSDAAGLVWTFRLADGAKWHDGLPVTPDDVRFTFEYIAAHNLPSQWIVDLIDRIDLVDRKVIFHLKRPCSLFPVNAGFVIRILPRHIWEKIGDPYKEPAKDMAVGSGPYVLEAFEPTSGTIRFRGNRQYHGGTPRVDAVEFHLFGTMDVLALALKKGGVDVLYNYASGIPAPHMQSLRDRPGINFVEADSLGIPALLGFNFDRPLLRRLLVRKALALAVDYGRVNQCLMDGKGTVPGPGLIPPSLPSHVRFPSWERDVEASRRMLTEEGLEDRDGDGYIEDSHGEALSLNLLARSDLWGDSRLVKLLAHDFGQVGIRLNVQCVDLAAWQAFLEGGRYDLVLFRTTPWGMMMHAGYGTGYFDSREEGSLNICRLHDPELFKLCDAVLAETRPDSRKDLYGELQAWYARKLPATALCWGKSFFPYSAGWQGFQMNHLEGGLANTFSWKTLRRTGSGTKDEK